jgi:hypothetical protein
MMLFAYVLCQKQFFQRKVVCHSLISFGGCFDRECMMASVVLQGPLTIPCKMLVNLLERPASTLR